MNKSIIFPTTRLILYEDDSSFSIFFALEQSSLRYNERMNKVRERERREWHHNIMLVINARACYPIPLLFVDIALRKSRMLPGEHTRVHTAIVLSILNALHFQSVSDGETFYQALQLAVVCCVHQI